MGAGCHRVTPATDTSLPARDLFEQARHMARDEFAARLIVGVRGDLTTAYDNPFSDPELAALIASYQAGRRE